MDILSQLAEICSQRFVTLNKETSPTRENILEAKKSKSQNALDFTCIEDIRNLNTKTLVEKFAESTSDELKRRYSYKCVILPEECDRTFKSYGSEKKANDNMRQHLQDHLTDLEDRIICGQWPPKREEIEENTTLSQDIQQKSSRKNLKSQHFTGVKMPAKRRENSRHKRKPTKGAAAGSFQRERRLNGSHSSFYSKINGLMKANGARKKVDVKLASQGFLISSDIKEEKVVEEEIVQDYTFEMCGPLCTHLNCSLSVPSTSQVRESPKSTAVKKGIESYDLLAQAVSLEHSYAAMYGIKVEKFTPETVKIIPPRRKRGCCIPQQLIIRTPPFPHVHVPLLPDCAGVEEIGSEFTLEQVKTESTDYSSDTRETSSSPPCKESQKSPGKGKRSSKRSRKQMISNSVLECVENRVDVNTSSIRVPNNLCPSPENSVENSENVQKAEREQALRYINKLRAKKKKQYQGPLECRICEDKQFTALATLIHHYRSHAGIKPYSCNLCDGTFTRQHSLNYHMLIHNGMSRFTCEFCHRTFRHPSHFKEHLRRHTGETPFRCPSCHLKFKTRNTFKRHLKIQHKKLLTAHNIVDLPISEKKE